MTMDKGIAFYLRLSVADGDLGEDNKNESNSIENQRQLLQDFVLKREDLLSGEIREYVDDGYTGTNFDRPGFQQMVKDAQAGKIGCILVKDLSRLGRDYIGAGDYIDQIFPMLGVRFIAVNNNIDSDCYKGTTVGMDIAINNLVNSFYSRDLSKKVRSSQCIKWKQGCATTPFPPFGYVWDPKSASKWKIDPVASKYVRKVFDLALEGKNTKQIAEAMNQAKIPTPGVYARATGKKSGFRTMMPEDEKCWETDQVWKILKRYEYTGALVMGKHQRVSFGSKTVRKGTEEELVVSENAHDAIITEEEFKKAQAVIKAKKPEKFVTDTEYPLKGMIRCGTCRRALRRQQHDGEKCFTCPHKKSAGEYSKCYDGFYRESEVNTKVAVAIRQVIQLAGFLDDKLQAGEDHRTIEMEIDSTEDKLSRRMDLLKAERIRQYESYADGVISKEEYLLRKQQLSREIEEIRAELQKISESKQETDEIMQGIRQISKQGLETSGSLTREMAEDFLEAVYLRDGNTIKVVFKCEDVLKKALDRYITDSDYAVTGDSDQNEK